VNELERASTTLAAADAFRDDALDRVAERAGVLRRRRLLTNSAVALVVVVAVVSSIVGVGAAQQERTGLVSGPAATAVAPRLTYLIDFSGFGLGPQPDALSRAIASTQLTLELRAKDLGVVVEFAAPDPHGLVRMSVLAGAADQDLETAARWLVTPGYTPVYLEGADGAHLLFERGAISAAPSEGEPNAIELDFSGLGPERQQWLFPCEAEPTCDWSIFVDDFPLGDHTPTEIRRAEPPLVAVVYRFGPYDVSTARGILAVIKDGSINRDVVIGRAP
jgi:hypothetical protein